MALVETHSCENFRPLIIREVFVGDRYWVRRLATHGLQDFESMVEGVLYSDFKSLHW